MTDNSTWATIAGRLTSQTPVDLDVVLWDGKTDLPVGGELVGATDVATRPVSQSCWPLREPGMLHLGVRITAPLNDPLALATALTAIAMERQMTPVVFSHLNRCGLEQFGLRIEHVTGSTQSERDGCEQDLKQYYQMAIMVDASDLPAMN